MKDKTAGTGLKKNRLPTLERDMHTSAPKPLEPGTEPKGVLSSVRKETFIEHPGPGRTRPLRVRDGAEGGVVGRMEGELVWGATRVLL